MTVKDHLEFNGVHIDAGDNPLAAAELALQTEIWDDAACLGYARKAMEETKVPGKMIGLAVGIMKRDLTELTADEAKKHA